MQSGTYVLPETIPWKAFARASDRATMALVRLDERLARSEVREGWRSRSHFREAAATMLVGGTLVTQEDLILFDAEMPTRVPTIELSRSKTILRARRALADRKASLLFTDEGLGELMGNRTASGRVWEPDRRSFVYDPTRNDVELRERFKAVVREVQNYPPVVAAAVLWDAWIVLEPVEFMGWRAGLIASALLRNRGVARHHLPLINSGAADASFRRDEFSQWHERVMGLMEWIEAGANRGYAECDNLSLAAERYALIAKGVRTSSKLPLVIDTLLSHPIVTVPMVMKKQKISQPTAQKLIDQLSPRELTGRSRYRAYAAII